MLCMQKSAIQMMLFFKDLITEDVEQSPGVAKLIGLRLHRLLSTISHSLNIVLRRRRDQWPYQRLVHDPITPVWQQASILLVPMHMWALTPPHLPVTFPNLAQTLWQRERERERITSVHQYSWDALTHPSPNPVGYHRHAAVLCSQGC